MASSVSSERAFSQGRITISKRRSTLKGDIVEALQCIKCAVRHDLLFKAAAPSSTVEAELNETSKDGEEGADNGSGDEVEELDAEEEGWNELLIEDEDEIPTTD